MTEKLYYQDAYRKEFSAVITAVKTAGGQTAVAFDQTAFYPEGGGQGADHGTIRLLDGGALFSVFDVQEEDGEIWHYIWPVSDHASQPAEKNKSEKKSAEKNSDEKNLNETKPHEKEPADVSAGAEATNFHGLQKGCEIFGEIDWERRFDHMQQHSGEHIVSGMICREFHCDNIGFHLGEEDVTIDYNTKISPEEILKIEEMANRYLWENHPLEVLWPSKEELQRIEYRSKKELEGDVRLTGFAGADICACCGTHVKSSAEVGLVKFTSVHSFHEGTRLTLYCGKRAMDFLRMNYQANKKTAVLLSTKEERTPEIVKKQMEDQLRLKARFSQLEDAYFRLLADSFSGKEKALFISDKIDAEQGRRLCDLIADRVFGLCAVFTKTEDGSFRYACMKRNSEIKEFILQMNQSLSGKGGGRDGFAQGTVRAEETEIRSFFADLE